MVWFLIFMPLFLGMKQVCSNLLSKYYGYFCKIVQEKDQFKTKHKELNIFVMNNNVNFLFEMNVRLFSGLYLVIPRICFVRYVHHLGYYFYIVLFLLFKICIFNLYHFGVFFQRNIAVVYFIN